MEGIYPKAGKEFGLEVGVFEVEEEGEASGDELESGGEAFDWDEDGYVGGDDEEGYGEVDGGVDGGVVYGDRVFLFLFKAGGCCCGFLWGRV